ncbi:MAG: FtsK/SpoIIIE domain-containing protein [Chloroflexota bacterium]
MNQEAQAINQLFGEHGVRCRVAPPPQSYQTSAVRVYMLERGQGVTVSKVTSLADELDEALTSARQEPVHCRFDRLPLCLEVPRPDPKPLLVVEVLKRLHNGRQHLDLNHRLLSVVGEANNYAQADCILLDLINPNSPHALIAGTTGSGKSNLLTAMAVSTAVLHSPQEVAMIILDPKGIDFPAFNRLPHLACPVVTEPLAAVQTLAQVVAELERRKREGVSGPRILVLIDELAELADVAGPQVESHIKRLLQVGRGLGIHVIGATQKPLASVIGSLVKANFPVRIVGKVASVDDARVAAGVSGSGAERLPGKGAMLLLRAGETKRIQAYLLPPNHVEVNIERIGNLWRGVESPGWRLPALTEEIAHIPVSTIAGPNHAQSYPEWLRDMVAEYVHEHGKPPSQKAVQRAYQEETGQMLNWQFIKSAIADGVAQVDDSRVTQP